MAKPTVLASAAELDDRLKRVDEARWLASRYAPEEGRRLLVGVGLLAAEIRRAMGMPEAMIGRIRIQWWRESIEAIRDKGTIRRHDLVEELAQLVAGRSDMPGDMLACLDAADAVLDDHLAAGGHVSDRQHEKRHVELEAALIRLAGRVLEPALTESDGSRLSVCADGWVARQAGLPDADTRWRDARTAFRALAPSLTPAVVHLATAPEWLAERPLLARWSMLVAVLTRSLPPLHAQAGAGLAGFSPAGRQRETPE
jgi:15-cis-phytoene synthase